MVSISKNTVIAIKQVYQIELKPIWMVKILLREMKQGVKYQRSVIQKDFLETCTRRSLCTKEIMDTAMKVMNDPSRREQKRNREEERRILKIRIEEKKDEIRREKET